MTIGNIVSAYLVRFVQILLDLVRFVAKFCTNSIRFGNFFTKSGHLNSTGDKLRTPESPSAAFPTKVDLAQSPQDKFCHWVVSDE